MKHLKQFENRDDHKYELHYVDNNMVGSVKANSVEDLLNVVKKRGLLVWEIFKNDFHFHSTTQEEYLIYWCDERSRSSYWCNMARKYPELYQKEYISDPRKRIEKKFGL